MPPLPEFSPLWSVSLFSCSSSVPTNRNAWVIDAVIHTQFIIYIILTIFEKRRWHVIFWNHYTYIINKLSENFSVSNGVRQGGVLSPILFIVYIDELLTRLESQAVGCYWSHYFIGDLGYADNIVLLAPSASEWCSIPVVNLLTITTFYLIQEKKNNLFDSPYLAPHLTHLHHRLFCLLANLSSWLIEPVI